MVEKPTIDKRSKEKLHPNYHIIWMSHFVTTTEDITGGFILSQFLDPYDNSKWKTYSTTASGEHICKAHSIQLTYFPLTSTNLLIG